VNIDELQPAAGQPPDLSFTLSKKDRQKLDLGTSDLYFMYEDAMPVSMRAVRLADLFSVAIHWKMLTDYRPVNKKEEDYFNRMIDLGKFKRDTKIQEAQQLADSMSNIPGSNAQVKALAMGFVMYKSKRGTAETKLKSCKDCGLELCTGIYCKLQVYDAYSRVILDKDELEAEENKGFSLKNVIAQANAPKGGAGAKDAKKKTPAKPSLTAMIFKAKKKKRKKKKKTVKDNDEPVCVN